MSSSVAHAAPGLTLPAGTVSGTLTLEVDASAGTFGDPTSIAPDLAAGVTDDLTLSVVHSTFARTGFRGSAGAGVCVTDACAEVYDNVGAEALYSLQRGAFSLAANAGVHAWSLARDHYVGKLGARLRYQTGRVTIASLPSVTIALTERDGTVPNRDRLWLPVTALATVASGLSLGLGTGLKGPISDLDTAYEVAFGALANYTISPELSLGASWIHGKALAGDDVAGADGLDSRVLNVWLTATR